MKKTTINKNSEFTRAPFFFKSGAGFTLIELIVVIGLVVACGGVLVELFLGHNRLYSTQTAELNIGNSARVSLDDIDNFVRQTNRILESYSTYTASSQVLILQIQSLNSSNQLLAGTFDNVVYYLQGTDLLRQVFPNAASSRAGGIKLLGKNVTSLSFTLDNTDLSQVTLVTTDITIQENAGGQTRSITASSQARLRNY